MTCAWSLPGFFPVSSSVCVSELFVSSSGVSISYGLGLDLEVVAILQQCPKAGLSLSLHPRPRSLWFCLVGLSVSVP